MLLSAILCTTIHPSALCSPLLSSAPLSSATPTVTSPAFCFPLIYAIAVCAPASRCTPAVWRYQPETFPMHFTRMDLPSVCISRKCKTHGSTFCLLTDPGQALWWCMWLHMLLCGCNPHCRFTAMLSNQSIAPHDLISWQNGWGGAVREPRLFFRPDSGWPCCASTIRIRTLVLILACGIDGNNVGII